MLVAEADGSIDGVLASFVRDAIADAEATGSTLVLQLDSAGTLDVDPFARRADPRRERAGDRLGGAVAGEGPGRGVAVPVRGLARGRGARRRGRAAPARPRRRRRGSARRSRTWRLDGSRSAAGRRPWGSPTRRSRRRRRSTRTSLRSPPRRSPTCSPASTAGRSRPRRARWCCGRRRDRSQRRAGDGAVHRARPGRPTLHAAASPTWIYVLLVLGSPRSRSRSPSPASGSRASPGWRARARGLRAVRSSRSRRSASPAPARARSDDLRRPAPPAGGPHRGGVARLRRRVGAPLRGRLGRDRRLAVADRVVRVGAFLFWGFALTVAIQTRERLTSTQRGSSGWWARPAAS